MKALFWIGIVLTVLWGILWLGVKIAVGAIHLLLLAGLVLIVWGGIKHFSHSSSP
ncbi:MAG TPA: hypothetical protein VFS24_11455 [Steroidobacteraceae bacterium]|jgi:hypothetical protein|nr:hypothetical protein [Steroidobacteraceae bacterium]HEU4653062.1 hypothetical protein [Steroidobacteraceae bacterium]